MHGGAVLHGTAYHGTFVRRRRRRRRFVSFEWEEASVAREGVRVLIKVCTTMMNKTHSER